MRVSKRTLTIVPLLFLSEALHGQASGPERAYLHAVAEHFGTPGQEVLVLSQWSLSVGEIPVVLFLADRAGISPDVVVAQRQRGRSWMDIAQEFSLHAGDFHVRVEGSPGFLAEAYARFGSLDASRWSTVSLSDVEVVGLVNVRFLSRFLGVSPSRVVRELGSGSVVEGYQRLRGGG